MDKHNNPSILSGAVVPRNWFSAAAHALLKRAERRAATIVFDRRAIEDRTIPLGPGSGPGTIPLGPVRSLGVIPDDVTILRRPGSAGVIVSRQWRSTGGEPSMRDVLNAIESSTLTFGPISRGRSYGRNMGGQSE